MNFLTRTHLRKNEDTVNVYLLYSYLKRKQYSFVEEIIENYLKRWSLDFEDINSLYLSYNREISKINLPFVWCLNLICDNCKQIDFERHYKSFLKTLIIINRENFQFILEEDDKKLNGFFLDQELMPFAFDQAKFFEINDFGIKPKVNEWKQVSIDRILNNIASFLFKFTQNTFEDLEFYNNLYFSKDNHMKEILSDSKIDEDIFIHLFKFFLIKSNDREGAIVSKWEEFKKRKNLVNDISKLIDNRYFMAFLNIMLLWQNKGKINFDDKFINEIIVLVFKSMEKMGEVEKNFIEIVRLFNERTKNVYNLKPLLGKYSNHEKSRTPEKLILKKKLFSWELEWELYDYYKFKSGSLRFSRTQTLESAHKEKLEILSVNYSIKELAIYLTQLVYEITTTGSAFGSKSQLFFLTSNLEDKIWEDCLQWIEKNSKYSEFEEIIKNNFIQKTSHYSNSKKMAQELFEERHLLKDYYFDIKKAKSINENIEKIINKFRILNEDEGLKKPNFESTLNDIDNLFVFKKNEGLGIFLLEAIDFTSFQKLLDIYSRCNFKFNFMNIKNFVEKYEKKISEIGHKKDEYVFQIKSNEINLRKFCALLNRIKVPTLTIFSYPGVIKESCFYEKHFTGLKNLKLNCSNFNINFHFLFLLKNIGFWWTPWNFGVGINFLLKQINEKTVKLMFENLIINKESSNLQASQGDKDLLSGLNPCINTKDSMALIFFVESILCCSKLSKKVDLKKFFKLENNDIKNFIDSLPKENLQFSDLLIFNKRLLVSIVKNYRRNDEISIAIENRKFGMEIWKWIIKRFLLKDFWNDSMSQENYPDSNFMLSKSDLKYYKQYLSSLHWDFKVEDTNSFFEISSRYHRYGGKAEYIILLVINKLIFENLTQEDKNTFNLTCLWKFLTKENERENGHFNKDWKEILLYIEGRKFFQLHSNIVNLGL